MVQWRSQPPILHSPWTLRVPVCRPVTAGRCRGQRLFLHSPWTLRAPAYRPVTAGRCQGQRLFLHSPWTLGAPACRPVTPCTVHRFLFEEKMHCSMQKTGALCICFFGRQNQVHSAPVLSSLIVALINPCRLLMALRSYGAAWRFAAPPCTSGARLSRDEARHL